jgi:hypothetical protein
MVNPEFPLDRIFFRFDSERGRALDWRENLSRVLEAIMGRPKSPNPKPVLPIVASVRGRPEWAEWLEGLRRKLQHRHSTDTFDRALADLAKQVKYPPPPPRY